MLSSMNNKFHLHLFGPKSRHHLPMTKIIIQYEPTLLHKHIFIIILPHTKYKNYIRILTHAIQTRVTLKAFNA